jgi:hypothetical protein
MTTTEAKTRRTLRGLLALLVLVGAGFAASATPAAAASPCWKQVLNDWFVDGRIDGTYPVACYTEAQQHIGEDAQQYSTAPQDIQRALLAAIRQDRPNGPGGGNTGTTTSGSSSSTPPSGGSNDNGGPTPTASGGGPKPPSKSPFTRVIDWLGPSNASSIPLPLLVLAGIALLLLAGAAASWFARRLHARRLRPAPPPEQP